MKDICCETCANLIPFGEGDYICDVEPLQLVLKDDAPAEEEDYFWCRGKYWKKR